MKISEVNKKYKNQWILAEVLEQDELSQPIKVKVITRSSDRDKIYEEIARLPRGFRVTTFYTGKIPKHGYAVAFLIAIKI